MKKDTEAYFLNPPPGSAAARARDFGIDLTLTLQRLRLTPDERVRQLQQAMFEIENMRVDHKPQDGKADDPSRVDVTTVDTTSG